MWDLIIPRHSLINVRPAILSQFSSLIGLLYKPSVTVMPLDAMMFCLNQAFKWHVFEVLQLSLLVFSHFSIA